MNDMNYNKYVNALEYPKAPSKPIAPTLKAGAPAHRDYADALDRYDEELHTYNMRRKLYNDEDTARYAEFKIDALKETGLWGHEAGNRAFELAWQQGHSAGYPDVFSHLVDIAYVVTGNN